MPGSRFLKYLITFALVYGVTLVSLALMAGEHVDKWELAAIPLIVAAAVAIVTPTRSVR